MPRVLVLLLAISVQASAQAYFQVPRENPVGSGPVSLIAVDLNGDGKLDLVTANHDNQQAGLDTITVLVGNGDGTFQGEVNYPLPGMPTGLYAGDLNGDGRPDVAVGILGSNGVSILYGNGDGTLQAAVTVAAGSAVNTLGIQGFAAGDVNGDGKADLITTNSGFGASDITVLLGNGNGTFQTGKSFALPINPGRLLIADLNADGKPDALVLTGGNMLLVPGSGDGTFGTAVDLGEFAQQVAIGDFDNDGRNDIILTTQNDHVRLLLNNGDGTFHTGFESFQVPFAGPVVAVDVDGDGMLDALVSTAFSAVVVLKGDAAGGLTLLQIWDAGSGASGMVAADFGRGQTDLAVASNSAGKVNILRGNGDGSFQSSELYKAGTDPVGLLLVDIDGDNNLDAVVPAGLDDNVLFFGGTADGGFGAPGTALNPFLFAQSPSSVAAGNLDGDGHIDLVVGDARENAIVVVQTNGTLSFPAAAKRTVAGNVDGVALADFNGDGKQDVLVNTEGFPLAPNALGVLNGNGDGTFQEEVQIPLGFFPGRFVTADFNGDGKQDIAVIDILGMQLEVLLGNGNGTFQTPVSYPAGTLPSGIALADVNSDGKPDLLVVGFSATGSVSVFVNTGTDFVQHTTESVIGPLAAVTAADVNGDGKPDLIECDGVNSVWVLAGNGDGSFQSPQQYAQGGGPSKIMAGDLNHDGAMDVVLLDGNARAIATMLNARGSRINVQTSPAPLYSTKAVTFMGGVTGSLKGVAQPTGTLELSVDGVSMGAVGLGPEGATFTHSPLTAGAHSLTATYSGDANFNARTVQLPTVNVLFDFLLSVSRPSRSRRGSTAREFNAVLQGEPTHEAVSFACDGLPAGMRCDVRASSWRMDRNEIAVRVRITGAAARLYAGDVRLELVARSGGREARARLR